MSELAPSVLGMELCSVFLRASVKAFRLALAPSAVFLRVKPSQSAMDVVSRLCTRICTQQTRYYIPLGLRLAVCDKPGTALRSPSDI